MSTFVVVGFMAIALLGVPIAFAMGLSAIIAIWLAGRLGRRYSASFGRSADQ